MREIPPGFVRTYGDVSPGAPRFAGAVLFECDDPDLPWWRVVRADGSLAKGARQRRAPESPRACPSPAASAVDMAARCEVGARRAPQRYSSRGVMRKVETTSACLASGWTT